MNNLQEAGTVTFWLRHENQQWFSDNNGYLFEKKHESFWISCSKNPDRSLIFIISSPTIASVVIAVPISQEIINFSLESQDSSKRNGIHVVYTWDSNFGKLYLNTIEVFSFEFEILIPDKFEFCISGQENIPEQSISRIINSLTKLLDNIYAFQEFKGFEEIHLALQSNINLNKFALIKSRPGSFIGIIEGVKKSVNFFTKNFPMIFVVLHGYTKRIAESYILVKESSAHINKEKLNQEKMKTASQALSLTQDIFDNLEKNGCKITENERTSLIKQFVLPHIQEISNELLNNNLTISINEDDGLQQ